MNMVARDVEDKAQIDELIQHLWFAEEEATWARFQLRYERSHRLEMEGFFTMTLKQTVAVKVAEVVALAQVEVEEERDRVIDAAIESYRASEFFQLVKVGCFLDGFEEFRK